MHGSAIEPRTSPKAYVNEVFLSFQGEGMLCGARQIFCRLAGCDIRCPWCDTPDALLAKDSLVARFETEPDGPFRELPNPLTSKALLDQILRIQSEHGPVEWVSLTGGEPTIWRRFLAELCPALKAAGLKIYLETNSHHPDTMRELAPSIDFVSADLKLPFRDYAIEKTTYADFFAAIPGAGQVKLVVLGDLAMEEFVEAAELVHEANDSLPLILQPVTPVNGIGVPPTPAQLIRLQGRLLEVVREVRVIPQTHKMLSVR
jgi:organic radical activating enzyme